MTEFSDRLLDAPAYALFRKIIDENIGFFPELKFAHHALADHRLRIFDGDRVPEIVVSERAIAVSEYLGDVISAACNADDTEQTSRSLAVLYGIELFLRNRIQGLAFVAHGYEAVGLMRAPIVDVLRRLTDFESAETRVSHLVRVFYPLGHEIGHFDAAQATAPAMFLGNAMIDVCEFNYPLVVDFTDDFDAEAALNKPDSPLFASHLREEVIADWFAIASLSHLVYQSASEASEGRVEFPLLEFVLHTLTLPVVNALQSLFWGKEFSTSLIQETALAMHCRYSTAIDSIRGMLKAMFGHGANADAIQNQIDDAIDRMVTEMDEHFRVVHGALLALYGLQSEFFEFGETEVMEALSRILADPQKQVPLGHLMQQIVKDSKGYPLNEANRRFLEKSWKSLLFFEKIVIDKDGRVVSAKR